MPKHALCGLKHALDSGLRCSRKIPRWGACVTWVSAILTFVPSLPQDCCFLDKHHHGITHPSFLEKLNSRSPGGYLVSTKYTPLWRWRHSIETVPHGDIYMSSKPPYYHHPKTQHHQGFDPLLFRQVKRFSSSHLPNTSSSPDDWVVGITPNHPIGKLVYLFN